MSRVSLAALLCGVTVGVGSATGQTFRQTQTDDYTRYELGDPESQSFRIYYDVSATVSATVSGIGWNIAQELVECATFVA